MGQNMPHLTGGEALARFRATHPNLGVILSTAGGSLDEQGASGILPKPCTATELREKVREALAQP